MTEPALTLAKSVTFVSSGTSGLGAEIARHLGREGAIVALGETPDQTADPDLTPPAASVHHGRLVSPEDCERVVEEVVDAHGRIDSVVCVTGRRGYTPETPLAKLDTTAWDRALAAWLSGPFYLLRAALPRMVAQGHGRLVLVLPVDGGPGTTGQGPAGVAAAGLVALTQRMSREVAGAGVTVNAVSCGLMETLLVPDEVQAEARALVPAGRLGRHRDVARVVAFLCDPESDYVTGQVLAADGGLRA